jgi:hypothetical protein
METAMINDVVLEGIVVKAWKYAQATSHSSASWMGCTKEGQADIKDIEADTGQMDTGVEILLPMSHIFLTKTAEQVK